jgi:sRNA-binding regulator protein Hfq
MGHNDERWGRRDGGGKPPPTSGISPAEARDLRAQVSALSSKVEKLEKFVKEQYDEKNQWNSTVREWVGKRVVVELSRGDKVEGDLLWLDRYTICVRDAQTKVIHKAAIAMVYRAGHD